MQDRDILHVIEGVSETEERHNPAVRASTFTLLLVGGLLSTGTLIQMAQGTDGASSPQDVQGDDTNRLGAASKIDTNYMRSAGLNITNMPPTNTDGMAADSGTSTSNSVGSLRDVLALPADNINSTNRLLDFPAWDNVSNNVPTDANPSKGNRKMHSR